MLPRKYAKKANPESRIGLGNYFNNSARKRTFGARLLVERQMIAIG